MLYLKKNPTTGGCQCVCETQQSVYLVYPVARAYEAKHYSKWYYVRMPAVTNIVVQKPKVAACQKKTKRLLHLNIIPPCSAGFV